MKILSVPFLFLSDLCDDENEEDIRLMIDHAFTYGDCAYSLVHRDDLTRVLKNKQNPSGRTTSSRDQLISSFCERLADLPVDYICL